MSTQSLILIFLIGFASQAFAGTTDIYAAIAQVKAKLESVQSLEGRKKEFSKFQSFICQQRIDLGPKVRVARQNPQLSEDQLISIELERYNYYDLCDYLKQIPNIPKADSNICENFVRDIKRSFDQNGTAAENTLTDLNAQAALIGQLLYRCH